MGGYSRYIGVDQTREMDSHRMEERASHFTAQRQEPAYCADKFDI